MSIYDTKEGVRLVMIQQKRGHWNRWGPFLAERAWGTVREDYSADGDAWNYFPTITLVPEPTDGMKMVWVEYAPGTNIFVSRWRCGTATIHFSRSGCLA